MIYEIDSSKTNALRSSPPKKSNRIECNVSKFCDGVENCTTAKGGVKYFMTEENYMKHMKDEHQVVVNVKTPEVSPLKKGAGALKPDHRVEEPSMFAPYYANKSTKSTESTKTDVMEEDEESVEDSRDVAIMAMQKQIDELTTAMQHILVLLTPPAPIKSQTKTKTKKVATPVLSEAEEDAVEDEIEPPVLFTPPVKKSVGRPKKTTPK